MSTLLKYITTLGVALMFGMLFNIQYSLCLAIILFLLSFLLINKNLEKSILFIAVLFPFNNILIVHLGFMDIRLMQLLWMQILFLIFIRASLNRNNLIYNIKFERIDIFFVLFIFSCLFQLAFIDFKSIIIKEVFQWVYLYTYFIILRAIFCKKENINKFIKGVYIGTVVFLMFGYIKLGIGTDPLGHIDINIFEGSVDYVSSGFKTQTSTSSIFIFQRIDSFFWGSVATANILLIQYFLVSLHYPKIKNFVLLGIVLLIILTGSRAGWVFFYSLFLVEAFIHRKNFFPKVLISGVCLFAMMWAFPWILDRFVEIFLIEESSNQAHLAIWSYAVHMIKTHPFLGIGTGCFMYYPILGEYFMKFGFPAIATTPHNIFLKLAAENGILGALPFTMFFAMLFLSTIKKYKHLANSSQFRLITLSFVATFVMNLTMNAFMVEAFWIILALWAASIKLTSKNYIGV